MIFNYLARRDRLNWQATSHGLALELGGANVEPISRHALAGLNTRLPSRRERHFSGCFPCLRSWNMLHARLFTSLRLPIRLQFGLSDNCAKPFLRTNPYRYILHDRDAALSTLLDASIVRMGLEVIATALRSRRRIRYANG